MVRRIFILVLLSIFAFSAKSQNLNWHITAQAGAANYQFENFRGAVLAGFQNMDGQQLSFGPVVKGYNINTELKTVLGGRIYSQARLYKGVSMYLQCDVFDGTRSRSFSSVKSPMRLETGAGITYTYREIIGLSAGYNLAELNPLTGVRKNTPAIKLIYLVPIGYRGW